MRPLRSLLYTLVLAGLALLVAGCLGEDGDRPTKLEALARWEDRRLAPQDSLATFLQDPDAHVRLAAVRSAGLIGRNDALVRMLDLLDDPSQTVRIQTCFSLGILGDSLAVPALEKATEDARPTVRLAALRGLAQVPNDGSALLKAAVAEEPREAAAAFDALRNQADRVPREDLLKVLRAGLVSDIPDIQWRTLRCVERAPDSTLVHLVIPYARSNDEQVRIHAFRALSRLGGTGAKEADLTKVTEHPFRGRAEVRLDVAACRALPRRDDAGLFRRADRDGGPPASPCQRQRPRGHGPGSGRSSVAARSGRPGKPFTRVANPHGAVGSRTAGSSGSRGPRGRHPGPGRPTRSWCPR